MHIAQVVNVSLVGSASGQLSYDAYNATKQWLTQWTPQANFKAVIASDLVECIRVIADDLRTTLVPHYLARYGVKPEHFKFNVSEQSVVDGRFWMSTQVVRGTDYYLRGD